MRVPEDPFDTVSHARFGASVQERRVRKLQTEPVSWSLPSAPRGKEETRPARRRPGKIHPLLEQWIRDDEPHPKKLIVTFHDDERMPRFPEPDPRQPPEAEVNEAARRRTREMIRAIRGRRAEEYDRLTEEVLPVDVTVETSFWLVKAVEVTLRVQQVPDIAEHPEVRYVEPRHAGDLPPQPNANAQDDVIEGREIMGLEMLANQGLAGGFIGLVDTGVRATHDLLDDRIRSAGDCVNGNADCAGGTPQDDADHGTGSAAILVGNASHGQRFRGITTASLDSFRAYGPLYLDQAAAVTAVQAAVAASDRVIAAVIAGSGDDSSALATAADAAFDAGAVVLAANGNDGAYGAGTVACPANAHRVIGVGNFDLETLADIASQSLGPAPDGRIKPDLLAPTNSETASAAADDAFKVYSGTSCATPYAAGAAALLREWLKGDADSIDPGHVNANLIVSAQPSPGVAETFDNRRGCGPIRFLGGYAWWGKTAVGDGMRIDIPIDLGELSVHTLDAALWWPESPPGTDGIDVHNDIDLYLSDPGGQERARSVSAASVFERARVVGNGTLNAGIWQLQIHGYSVTGEQTVYWAVRAAAA